MRLRISPLALVFLSISVAFLSAQAPAAIPRIALVIGNSDYTAMPKLKNPVNDATDLTAALKRLGFKITLLTNANRKAMNQGIVAFREKLAQDRQSEGVFFFAGHGVQAKGVNYLIPIGADIQAEVDLDDEAVSAQKILGSLEEARNRVNLVILDACRDNPLPSTLRSSARGLAVVTSAPPETLILYSTAAGQTASDGEGRNSPFARALLAHVADAGDVTQTVKVITGEVKKATGGQQTPYVYMGLSVDFALNAATRESQASPPPAATQQPTMKLKIEKIYGSVAIETATAGTLLIDGESQGAIPTGRKATLENVEAGLHSLVMKYDDGSEETRSIVLKGGEPASVIFSHVVAASSTRPLATTAPAPPFETAKSAPQASALADGASLPVASIKIDGKFEDWQGIPPAFTSGRVFPGIRQLAIDRVYIAVDSTNLHLRLDTLDTTPSSSSHPNNFETDRNCQYGLDFWNLSDRVTAFVGFSVDTNTWTTEIGISTNGQYRKIEKASGNYAMKGSWLEASFNLDTITRNLGLPAQGGSYKVNARTGFFDEQGHVISGSYDRTDTKQFIHLSSALQGDTAEEPALGSSATPATAGMRAALSSGERLPQASIKIDGKFDDWSGILPAFTSTSRTLENQSLAIDKVYLAVDEGNLYMRFDIKDVTPSSFLHQNNFDARRRTSYAIDLRGLKGRIIARLFCDDGRWRVQLLGDHSEYLYRDAGNYAMRGAMLEASFPLEPIQKHLGPTIAEGYSVAAFTGYNDSQGNWVDGDYAGADRYVF